MHPRGCKASIKAKEQKMKDKVNNFINGAAILSAAGIIVKILGAIFRIPLSSIIGSEGMGLYQLAYPLYSFLLVISSAGFPVAISRLVAQAVNRGDYKLAERTFKLSRKLMFTLGLIATVIMLLLSDFVSQQQGNPDSKFALLAIAPAILFVSVLASYRGYFQGMQNMVPTAISQIIEQFIKLVAGLGFAAFFVQYGVKWGAAGAVAGVTLSELVALFFIVLRYRKAQPQLSADISAMSGPTSDVTSKAIIKDVLVIAVPVAIGSAIMPLVSLIDQLIVINGLKTVIPFVSGLPFSIESFAEFAAESGVTIDTALSMTQVSAQYPELYEEFITSLATSLYGIMSGNCSPITALPLIFSMSLAISIVPAISKFNALKNEKSVHETTSTSLRLTALIAFPCAIGICVLAEPIIRVLYSRLDAWEIHFAVNCLRILSMTVLVLPLIQSATAVLQGLGKQNIPVINLAIGAILIKIPLTYFLVQQPALNIFGAATSSVSIYAFAAIADIACVKYYTKVKLAPISTFVKPLVSAILMGVVAFVVYTLLYKVTQSLIISMGLAVIAGVLVYFAMVFITKMIKKTDLEYIPKGELILKKFSRFFD